MESPSSCKNLHSAQNVFLNQRTTNLSNRPQIYRQPKMPASGVLIQMLPKTGDDVSKISR